MTKRPTTITIPFTVSNQYTFKLGIGFKVCDKIFIELICTYRHILSLNTHEISLLYLVREIQNSSLSVVSLLPDLYLCVSREGHVTFGRDFWYLFTYF